MNLESKLEILEMRMRNFAYEVADLNVKTPKVKNKLETIDCLVDSNISIARFGDGEISLMLELDSPHFQNVDKKLAERLKEVLSSNNENIMIGIINIFGSLNEYKEKDSRFLLEFLAKYRDDFYKYINMDQQYYDAAVTRPYISIEDSNLSVVIFDKFKQLWRDKDIVIVEGDKSRLGVGNDLFAGAKSISRILCPAENAFAKYDEILEKCKKESRDKLFLLALGPTATVLAYDMAKLGYRALDIGHIDIEYEWYLAGSKKKTVIKNKYVNEKKKGRVVGECKDQGYLKSIKATIS